MVGNKVGFNDRTDVGEIVGAIWCRWVSWLILKVKLK
jgi:hypothetical protein